MLNRYFNLDLVKLPGNSDESYYVFPDTCQIPNLSYIYELFFDRAIGTLVEIGAYDGYTFSNTTGLIEKNWKAFLVEPVPQFAAKISELHKNNPNVTLLPIAVSDTESDLSINVAGALTTANRDLLEEYRQIEWARSSLQDVSSISVSATTLSNLINRLIKIKVDLLVVDVEGHEESVFATFNEIGVKPSMVIVELSEMHPDIKSSTRGSLVVRKILEESGYQIVFKDAVNTIFVDDNLFKKAFKI